MRPSIRRLFYLAYACTYTVLAMYEPTAHAWLDSPSFYFRLVDLVP